MCLISLLVGSGRSPHFSGLKGGHCYGATTPAAQRASLLATFTVAAARSNVAVRGSYGVFGHGMAHTGTGVERNSLPPHLPQGMGPRAKLLAGHASGARESMILVATNHN